MPTVSKLVQSFTYDFNKMGGTGTFSLGIQLPPSCFITTFYSWCTATIVAGGGSGIIIGSAKQNNIILGTTNYTNFVANTMPVVFTPMGQWDATVPKITSPQDNDFNVYMTVAGASFTAGSFIGFIEYFFPGN